MITCCHRVNIIKYILPHNHLHSCHSITIIFSKKWQSMVSSNLHIHSWKSWTRMCWSNYWVSCSMHPVLRMISSLPKHQTGQSLIHWFSCLNLFWTSYLIYVKSMWSQCKLYGHTSKTPCGNKDKAKAVDERFKLFGKALVIVSSTCFSIISAYSNENHVIASLYPLVNYCTDSLCNQPMKGLKLQKTDQTQGILYTLNSVCPVWVIRFQCESSFLQKVY